MADAFQTLGSSGGTDENLVSTAEIPYYVDNIDAVWTVGDFPVYGLSPTGRSWNQIENGKYKVTVTYQGYVDGEEPDELEETEKWSLDFDFSEEPIESHVNLAEIKKVYGGQMVEDKLVFKEILPKGSSARTGLTSRYRKATEKNPMHGVSTYILLKARITRTFSWTTVPSDTGIQIGRVYQTIPGLPDDLADVRWGERDWMLMPPKITPKGDIWAVTQDYLLSPPGGWPYGVYGQTQR